MLLNLFIQLKSQKVLAYLVIFLFLTITMSGCANLSESIDSPQPNVYGTRSEWEDFIKTVELAPSIIHPLTFTKGNFSIIVESDIFYDRFSKESKVSRYNQTGIQETITEIKNIQKNGKSIRLDDYKLGFSVFVEEVLLDLTTEGKTRIFDEHNAEFLTRVILSDYGMRCGPTCGYGSQRITTENKTIIFEKMTWVS